MIKREDRPRALDMGETHPPYAMFTAEEMEMRYARARALMERERLDALLITGEENFQYFAGTSASLGLHYSLTRPSVFILPLMADPVIITQRRDQIFLGCHVR